MGRANNVTGPETLSDISERRNNFMGHLGVLVDQISSFGPQAARINFDAVIYFLMGRPQAAALRLIYRRAWQLSRHFDTEKFSGMPENSATVKFCREISQPRPVP